MELSTVDLSKVYDCLRHDLSIAKLKAYDLDNGSLKFLLDSKWSKIRRGIP